MEYEQSSRRSTCAARPAHTSRSAIKRARARIRLHPDFSLTAKLPPCRASCLETTSPTSRRKTTCGKINFYEFLGNSWGILFSHPGDYTPVCTTELARAAQLYPEFARRGIRMISLSVNSMEDHRGWIKDINAYNGDKISGAMPFPMIADEKRDVSIKLGMLNAETDYIDLPLTVRSVFIIDPDKKLKLSLLYPASTGRNFDEILRVVDSLQLTAKHKIATPVDWQPGDKVIVSSSVSEDEARKLFPCGVCTKDLPSGKKYLRFTPQPRD
ncbi:peroxiredoxin-6-like [Rhinatrema bivittatum]|uniref:peroxiredoxin-6-like n=1 Tax=Rhinatrema bivittatum TaxID=194408 RepID=UPI00112C94DC|nr:peroxiredoxin-6-like [Rhinatrema bivittatum]